jgi:hypothetical protein
MVNIAYKETNFTALKSVKVSFSSVSMSCKGRQLVRSQAQEYSVHGLYYRVFLCLFLLIADVE